MESERWRSDGGWLVNEKGVGRLFEGGSDPKLLAGGVLCEVVRCRRTALKGPVASAALTNKVEGVREFGQGTALLDSKVLALRAFDRWR
jgi:hypothetical protein